MRNSLKIRLLTLLILPLTAILLIGALAAYFLAWRPATAAYDQALADAALALAQRLHVQDGRLALDLPNQAEEVLRTDEFDTIYFYVRSTRGDFAAGDAGVPSSPLPARRAAIFFDGVYRGRPVRVAELLTPAADTNVTIQVAETTVKRDRLEYRLIVGVLVPQALLLLITGVLVWYAVGHGLAPLNRLQADIAGRSHRDLAPVDAAQAPEETRPLVDALNALLVRLREGRDAQRRFIADAAHQLRTPLAALRMQLELAQASPTQEDLNHTLAQLNTTVERTARLANQLLSLARAEPGALRLEAFTALDLRAVVSDAAEIGVQRALAKNIDLGFELLPAPVMAEPLLIRELFANILDNALIYTPDGGRITVYTGSDGTRSTLAIEDDGPGIAPEERDHVMERFYRARGASGTGSGLGLAIVSEIAEAHRAITRIEAGKLGVGTRVSVMFPTPG
jgi:two-component system sensor histidine kinase TctE